MSQNMLKLSIQVYISLVEKYWNESKPNLIHLFIYLICKITKSNYVLICPLSKVDYLKM